PSESQSADIRPQASSTNDRSYTIARFQFLTSPPDLASSPATAEQLLINSLLNNLVFEAFSFSRVDFSLGYKGMVWVFLSTETAHPSHLSCSGHQGSQSAQVVGGSGEGKQPPHLVDSSQLHFL